MRRVSTSSLIVLGILAVLTVAVDRSGHDEALAENGRVVQLAQAESPASKPESTETQKAETKRKVRRRLPNHYGKVGLSRQQRKTVYGIQAKYREKLDELERQIAELESQRDMEIFAVLTDRQQTELKKYLEEARRRREARRKRREQSQESSSKSEE